MALALVLGTLTTAAVALAAAGHLRIPSHTRCPECGSHTRAALPRRWARGLTRWITFRWCPVCSWEGIGRRGPEIPVPAEPPEGASGFGLAPSAENPAEPPARESGARQDRSA